MEYSFSTVLKIGGQDQSATENFLTVEFLAIEVDSNFFPDFGVNHTSRRTSGLGLV